MSAFAWWLGLLLALGPELTLGQGIDSGSKATKNSMAALSSEGVRPSSVNSTTVASVMPATYKPGVGFTVTINASPDSGVFSYLVEDQPPVGWAVANVTQGGIFDAPNRKVKWGPFFDNLPRVLTYQVTPSASAAGTVTFSGIASLDGANIVITGQRSTAAENTVLPTITISATDANAAEAGRDPGTLTLARTGSTGSALTVNYSLTGTASSGADYAALGGSSVIPAGSATVTLTILPVDDALVEGNETVIASLAPSANYTLGASSSATVTIADNDLPVDATPPSLTVTSHSNGQIVSTSAITLVGTATDSGQGNNGISSVAVNNLPANGGSVAGNGTANWSLSVPLNPGQNNLVVVARDNSPARNSRTISLIVNYAAGPSTAVSAMPSTARPNQPATITIVVTPAAGVTSYIVEDQPPAGWMISNINQGGLFDASNRKVKWGPFFDNTPRTFTYQATPPASAQGQATFVGIVSIDGVNMNITGQRASAIVSGAPTISSIPDLKIIWNKDSDPIAFTVDDAETAPADLRISGASDNQKLISPGGLQFAPVGGAQPKSRTLVIRPERNQYGTANVTLTVTDSQNRTATTKFQVRVLTPPTIGPIADQIIPKNGSVGPINVVASDAETFPGFLAVTAESFNKGLLPDSGLKVTRTGANWSITITPAPNQDGAAKVEVKVTDLDGLSASAIFVVTVRAPSVTVTASAGANGSILPVGLVLKQAGEEQLFTATPAANYIVDQWLVDQKVAQVGGNTFRLSNIQANTSVSVTFRLAPVVTRLVRVEGDLSFGDVVVGNAAERRLTIFNDGNSNLTVSSIAYPAGFSGNWSGFVEPGKSQVVTVTFRPTAAMTYTGNVEVRSNATGGNSVKAASGTGKESGPRAFSSAARITIRDNTSATPYPSVLNVSGVSGSVTKITVTLRSVTHSFTRDIGVLLVGPGGRQVVLMRRAGSKSPAAAGVRGVSLTFDDSAQGSLPFGGQTTPGVYRPSDYSSSLDFPAPAPAGPYSKTLNVFNGVNANGTWSLYVADSEAEDLGAIESGWSLAIATSVQSTDTDPTISQVSDQVTPRDTPNPPIVVTIGDKETPANSLVLSASSSNTTLVPDANIFLDGTGSSRTVRVIPAPGQVGVTTITLTVTDAAGLSSASSFKLIVSASGGTVQFNNRIVGTVDARVRLADGTGVGAGWTAQLYAGLAGTPVANLRPVLPTTTFRTTPATATGYVNPVDVTVSGVEPGQRATIVMRAYNGASYETSVLRGESAPITIELGGAGSPPTLPATLAGLQGFTILSAGAAPVIQVQPLSQTAPIGTSVLFRVQATGTEPLSYQWQFNGAAIAGATYPLYVLSDLRPGHAGDYRVVIANQAASVTSATATLTVVTPPPPPSQPHGDLNKDGMPDVVFQDQNGFLAVWFMEGANMTTAAFLEPSNIGDTSYRLVTSSDINKDGHQDLIFQRTDGTLAVWFMNGVQLISPVLVEPSKPENAGWRLRAAADLSGDGATDLILQHTSGTIDVWTMSQTKRAERVSLSPTAPNDPKWEIVGAGDFNGDGKADLVFQHTDGSLAAWLITDYTASGALLNPSNSGDSKLRVVSAADRNRDGMSDLLFQDERDGSLVIWFMNGINRTSSQAVNPSKPGGTWKVVAPR